MIFQQKEKNNQRIEGLAKVTGQAKYSAEYQLPNLCYAVMVNSTIAAGKIVSLNTQLALQQEGVIDILSYFKKPDIPAYLNSEKLQKIFIPFPVFYNDTIYFKGQPIALVIADSFENASFAASLVQANYEPSPFKVNFFNEQHKVPLKNVGKERGSLSLWKDIAFEIKDEYTIQAEIHNPMEMHATIAHWEDDQHLKMYDKNQGVNAVQNVFHQLYEIPTENINVVSEYVGGGFGSGLLVWPNTMACVMAAKYIKRPVKLMLARQDMFYSTGHRPASWQSVHLTVDKEAKFIGALYQARNACSTYQNFDDGLYRIARLIYQFPNLKTESAVVPLSIPPPTWMRGPGECSGAFGIESAIDDLCYKIDIDPIQFRLKNLALTHHPDTNKPWSTHYINESLIEGAKQIHWENRFSKPLQIKEGDSYIGYGMAIGMWGSGRRNASAALSLNKEGKLIIKTAITDIGTGTGTGIAQIAHDLLKLNKNNIKVDLGNSDFPKAPSQGGSIGMSSISGAIVEICNQLKAKLVKIASEINQNYSSENIKSIFLNENGIYINQPDSTFISYENLWKKISTPTIEIEGNSGPGEERNQWAFCSSAAHFCKLKVNPLTGKIKILNFVTVVDAGKIINEMAATNQVSGAVIGGIGMAILEEQLFDQNIGGMVGTDFASYHIPVNLDAPMIEVHFINKPDYNANPSGVKGLGEVGIIGSAAAIANAIYNAIGKRCKNLPITPSQIIL